MKRINEIFYSIQGEGFHTGTPAVFVRFAGCNLKCSFCDTLHDPYKEMTDEQIVEEVSKHPCRMVVITGGEPGLQVTAELIRKLQSADKYVAVETNGTIPIPTNADWVTCSPKGDYEIKTQFDELKIVMSGKPNLKKYEQMGCKQLYLQPCSGENIEETVAYIMQNPEWKLSLQTHKFINLQ